jgi:hypothetical protein
MVAGVCTRNDCEIGVAGRYQHVTSSVATAIVSQGNNAYRKHHRVTRSWPFGNDPFGMAMMNVVQAYAD